MKVLNNYEDLSKATALHGPLLPVSDAANLCGISRQRVWALVNESRVVAFSLGGAYLVAVATIRERKTPLELLDEETDTVWAWVVGVDKPSSVQSAQGGLNLNPA